MADMTRMEYVLSLSYGKDSLACIEACKRLGYRIDRIVHAEVWATDTISADLPPMVEFKDKADKIIKERYGLEVERYSVGTYEEQFYTERLVKRLNEKRIYGFPIVRGNWCNSKLKIKAIEMCKSKDSIDIVGIASDEPKRIEKARQRGDILPLVDIGWTEADCRKWCEENDLLSPIYTDSLRGGVLVLS